jgi:hypothetical protein
MTSLIVYLLLTEEHHVFHKGITTNNEDSCPVCVKDISTSLNVDANMVSKYKRQGHFIYQINYIITSNGKELIYFYNGDFRRELIPCNTLLLKILEENELKKKFIKSVKKVYQ